MPAKWLVPLTTETMPSTVSSPAPSPPLTSSGQAAAPWIRTGRRNELTFKGWLAERFMVNSLPTQAEVYLDFRKRLYYRKHSFDYFMLFSVDAQDTLQADKHTAHSQN